MKSPGRHAGSLGCASEEGHGPRGRTADERAVVESAGTVAVMTSSSTSVELKVILFPYQIHLQLQLCFNVDHLKLCDELRVQRLQGSVVCRLGRPANDQTLIVGRRGLGNDMEMDVVDLLVRDPAVVLRVK